MTAYNLAENNSNRTLVAVYWLDPGLAAALSCPAAQAKDFATPLRQGRIPSSAS